MYCLDSLFSDIESLKIYAGIHSKHFNQYYRLLSKRFPFAIYYLIEDETVNIYAVLDTRMNPSRAKNILK
jgi:plasmid stabilization system protein ParE